MNETAEKLVELLARKGLTVACAESCTGGLLSAALTDVPGCSAVLHLSAVTYANSAKMALLGVDWETLSRDGAVSRACVEKMARGIRELADADLGVAVTGIAGPGGASEQKPVGTVFIAVSAPHITLTKHCRFGADKSRAEIRALSVQTALELALRMAENRFED